MSYFYSTVVKCGKPEDIANGRYSPMREDYDFESVVTYSCSSKDYTLNGSKSLDCRDDGKFHPAPPACIGKSQCCFQPFLNCGWVCVCI